MKTQVIMKRDLFGEQIQQQSKTEFFSANDLVRAGNKWRIANGLPAFNLQEWFRRKSSKEFINELQNKYGKVKIAGRGRNSNTWVHPLLFIDIALAINPKLKIEVYEWLFYNLIKFRNNSGDSYKEMAGALWVRCKNKRQFSKYIQNVALQVKNACGVTDWETATEEQLRKRDLIHNSIKTLANVLSNPDDAVRLGIKEHINLHN